MVTLANRRCFLGITIVTCCTALTITSWGWLKGVAGSEKPPCWTLGQLWSNACGVSAPCEEQLCVQTWYFVFECPEGRFEHRPLPGYQTNWVPACQQAPTGRETCTTDLTNTTWCVQTFPCIRETCLRDPVTQSYHCRPDENNPGGRCGIAPAVLGGAACP